MLDRNSERWNDERKKNYREKSKGGRKRKRKERRIGNRRERCWIEITNGGRKKKQEHII
jgi:hypothetical protein